MNGINKVILIGNLGKDPETQKFDSGTEKTSFSIATTEVFKNKEGEKKSQTEWHNIVLWGKLAEIAESYLTKGSTVYIEGKIRRREWENKEGTFIFGNEAKKIHKFYRYYVLREY